MITVVEHELSQGWEAWVDPTTRVIYVDPRVATFDIPEVVAKAVADLLAHQHGETHDEALPLRPHLELVRDDEAHAGAAS